ncbi:hypothetical protein ADIAL_1917 [Alkalibacterium sp. AK22]|uniref:hypothetical protein n=1 Tax=Alkalibacterium sp. AK22 TaxID=1229520 RepID=UPI0004469BF3|nr:hypothetical protein [Alkalibacterium sp. AK22]EXJ22663.1 hypothetical protein ADIAL_1917 [Alkalibacterium sp. AK22]
MKSLVGHDEKHQLNTLCKEVERLFKDKQYELCLERATLAVGQYPHAAEPHNLLGVLLEAKGMKAEAMKHYRAAIALEPGYRPARENLYRNGDLSNNSQRYSFK